MNLIADTIAATTSSNSNSNSNSNSKSNTNSTLNNNSTNLVTSIEDKILGTWKADSAVNLQGEELGLSNVFGTGVIQSNEIEFRKNGVLLYSMGVKPSSDNEKYTISGNTIKYGVPTDIKGKYVWSTFTYNPEEDTLEEEIEPFDEKVIVTYVRAK
ncbi:MAG: hypothetical protein K6D97_04795 [Clostridia bacterium]|nr:hypothetical protein [Clostridia bacterium]